MAATRYRAMTSLELLTDKDSVYGFLLLLGSYILWSQCGNIGRILHSYYVKNLVKLYITFNIYTGYFSHFSGHANLHFGLR